MIDGFPIKGLDDEEQRLLQQCAGQLAQKQRRAKMRSSFYNTRDQLDKVGFSIPPSMANLEAVLGWPAKAIDSLSARLKLYGFVTPGKKGFNTDLQEIFAENRMEVDWPQAQTGTLLHGVSFVAVTKGDASAGEPEVMVQAMPATEATGVWDVRRRNLTCALWCPDSEHLVSTLAVFFTKDRTITMTRPSVGGEWKIDPTPNSLPRVPVTPVVFRGQLGRPFGTSRLSRAAIYLCQMAARTLLRTEVGGEFYSSPQRYAMGASAEDFEDENGNTISAWETILGKTWLIGRDDETGELPQVGQFPQATMQPHVEVMRMITTLYAAEMSLPVGSLGIIHDNPASAAAIDAAWADMVSLAEETQVPFGSAAVEIAQNALMTKNGQRTLSKDLLQLKPKWRNAATPTLAAQTDAVTKQITAGMLQPDSVVALEQAGYDDTDIERIQAEHAARKAEEARKMAELGNTLNGAPNAAAGDGAAAPGQPGAGARPAPAVGAGVGGNARPPGA